MRGQVDSEPIKTKLSGRCDDRFLLQRLWHTEPLWHNPKSSPWLSSTGSRQTTGAIKELQRPHTVTKLPVETLTWPNNTSKTWEAQSASVMCSEERGWVSVTVFTPTLIFTFLCLDVGHLCRLHWWNVRLLEIIPEDVGLVCLVGLITA